MRRVVSILSLVLLLGVASASAQEFRGQTNMPGPFHPFNVTGKFAAHFHCLVTEHDLDPGALMFINGVEGALKDKDLRIVCGDATKSLLARLENLAEANPNTRLETFVVFYGDGLRDVVRDDDERDKLSEDLKGLEQEVRGLADKMRKPVEGEKPAEDGKGLRHVVLALASRDLPRAEDASADPKLKKPVPLGKQYGIVDANETTVVAYRRFRIFARHDLAKGALDEAKAKELYTELKNSLGAKYE